MDNVVTFKKYFNRYFWKAFQNKTSFFNVPKSPKQKEVFIECLHKEIQNRSYYPSVPQRFIDRDKGNCVTRIVPVFTLKDYCVYYYCIKKIEDKIAYNRVENTFGGWTLGGLMRKSEDDEMEKRRINYKRYEDFVAELHGISVSEYSFNPLAWAKAYGDLNSKLYLTAKATKYKYVAELDIANFYDSIRLDILEMRIREIVNENHADIISLLFHFLNYWNRNANLYNKQTVGIPQDAMNDCSRILANYYLQPYDKFVNELCKNNNSKYLRYADDQFIFSKDIKNLHYLIFKISKKLNELGLSINQKKVEIRTTNELMERRSFKIFDIIKEVKDKKDKNKVQQFVDCYLNLLDGSGLANIRERGIPLLNRALSCPALKFIDFPKITKLIACYLDDVYLKSCNSYQFEKIYKLLNKDDRPLLINKLNSLSRKLIHNSFHYELLNFYEKYKFDTRPILRRVNKLNMM